MIVRAMEVQDVDSIEEIERQIFSSPWSKDDFLYELTTNQLSHNIVLEEAGSIIGYIGFWLLGDQTQITTLGIRKEYQGRGYAKLLMDTCINRTKLNKYPVITLEVRVSNKKAIALYQGFGFTVATIRKNYYQDTHEDAYLMIKEMEV